MWITYYKGPIKSVQVFTICNASIIPMAHFGVLNTVFNVLVGMIVEVCEGGDDMVISIWMM